MKIIEKRPFVGRSDKLNTKTMRKAVLVIMASVLMSGCSQQMFDFTIMSTRNIELSKLSALQRSNQRVEGEDKAHFIIVIPTKIIRIDQAVDRTIAATPGCVALLDGTVYHKSWWIPYIYAQERYVVEATPLIDPNYSSAEPVLPKYGRVNFNTNGTLRSIEAISEVAYQAEKEEVISRKRKAGR